MCIFNQYYTIYRIGNRESIIEYMNLEEAYMKYKAVHKDAPPYDWYDGALAPLEKSKITKSLNGYD